MFKKRQTSEDKRPRNTNNVPASGSAVFSYYASGRKPQSPVKSKRSLPRLRIKTPPVKSLLYQLPFLLASLGILVSIGYTLSTDMNPKIIVSKDSESALMRQPAAYQAAAKRYLQSNLLNRCKILIDSSNIKKKLLNDYPELADAEVAVPLIGRRPVISLAAARPAITLSAGHGAYVIDSRGRAIIKVEDSAGLDKGLPAVTDQSGLDVQLNHSVLPSSSIAFIEIVTAQVKAKGLVPSSFTLPAAANELLMRIEGKPYALKFNFTGDPRLEAGTYLAVRDNLEKRSITPAEYIDVRVPEKAYYK